MTPANPGQPRRVVILGSTGSIGVNTIRVIEHLNENTNYRFEIVGLAAGSNCEVLAKQAQTHHVCDIAIADPDDSSVLRTLGDCNVRNGPDSAEQLVEEVACDLVVAAMVGFAGLPAVLAAIEQRRQIALANKETLVAAGELVMPRARGRGVHIIPIDSEHSAILQCLIRSRHRGDRSLEPDIGDVRRIVLTASGGPFRDWSAERMRNATVEEALHHPTWDMGPKITIDSATMMNKSLEVIEANWLFGLPSERIDVVVHPQSMVHGLVEFNDGSVVAQLAPPDMKGPIQFALTAPERLDGCAEALDWSTLRRLDFEPPDEERFPALRLSRQVIEAGGAAGAVLNAANEEAVESFLDGNIEFGRIIELVEAALDEIPARTIGSIEEILAADEEARAFVRERIRND